MSSECSSFIVLQSDPRSPLFSILYFLLKDQTLKRTTRQLGSHPALLNTSHTNRQRFSPYDSASSPRIAQAPQERLAIRRPCSVITLRAGFISTSQYAEGSHDLFR